MKRGRPDESIQLRSFFQFLMEPGRELPEGYLMLSSCGRDSLQINLNDKDALCLLARALVAMLDQVARGTREDTPAAPEEKR